MFAGTVKHAVEHPLHLDEKAGQIKAKTGFMRLRFTAQKAVFKLGAEELVLPAAGGDGIGIRPLTMVRADAVEGEGLWNHSDFMAKKKPEVEIHIPDKIPTRIVAPQFLPNLAAVTEGNGRKRILVAEAEKADLFERDVGAAAFFAEFSVPGGQFPHFRAL